MRKISRSRAQGTTPNQRGIWTTGALTTGSTWRTSINMFLCRLVAAVVAVTVAVREPKGFFVPKPSSHGSDLQRDPLVGDQGHAEDAQRTARLLRGSCCAPLLHLK